jgi:hypothetical protein
VWDVKSGDRVFEVGDELDAVLAADLRADHAQIALGGSGRVLRVYLTSDGQMVGEVRKHTDWITAIEYSPDGVLLATADRNGGIFVWEAGTLREYCELKGHSAAITGLSWRSDSNALVSSSEDGTVRLWELEEGRQITSIGAHSAGVLSAVFARDGRIVSCGRDATAKLWDAGGNAVRSLGPLPDLAVKVAFCDETDCVVVGDWVGQAHVYRAADGGQLSSLSTNPPSLRERLDEAKRRLAELTAGASAGGTSVQAAEIQQQVDRWQNEINFAQALAEFKEKEVVARKQADELASAAEAARSRVAEAEKAATEAAGRATAAREPLERIEREIAALRGIE